MGKVIPNVHLFLILLFLSLLIFALDTIKFLQIPKSAAYFITNPISFSLYSTKQVISKQFYFIFLARFAAQENKAMQAQLGQLLSENANLRRKLAEAEAQLSQKEHLDPRVYNLMPARPIGLDRYLKIDKGERDGLKIGQAVVFKDNFLGQIVATSAGSANIKLITDPDSKIAAFSIGQDGRAKGVLLGQFGLEMLMDKILHEDIISEGDLVYSEGTEGAFPRGLILGRVVIVEKKEQEPFQSSRVTPLFDIRDLEVVFIIQE